MKRRTDQELGKLADAAFRQAAQKVIDRAIAMGTSVIVYENGAVKEMPPEALREASRRPRRARKRARGRGGR